MKGKYPGTSMYKNVSVSGRRLASEVKMPEIWGANIRMSAASGRVKAKHIPSVTHTLRLARAMSPAP